MRAGRRLTGRTGIGADRLLLMAEEPTQGDQAPREAGQVAPADTSQVSASFDRRKTIAWEEKIFWRTDQHKGKTVHLVGC